MSSDITTFPIKQKLISELDAGTVASDTLLVASISGVAKKITAQSIADLAGAPVGLGTAAYADLGTDPGEVPELDAGGYVPQSTVPLTDLVNALPPSATTDPTALVMISTDGVLSTVTTQSIADLASSGNGMVGIYNNYQYKTGTTPPPDNGHIKLNNATHTAATVMYVSMLNIDGTDIDLFLDTIKEKDYLYLQDRDNSAAYFKYEVSGTPSGSHATGYRTFPITYLSGTASFSNNHAIIFYVQPWIPGGTLAALTDVDLGTLTDREVLTWDNTVDAWVNSPVNYDDITGTPTLGTAASKDTGTGYLNVPILNIDGLLDASVIPILYINKITVGVEATRTTAPNQNLGDTYKCTDSGISYMLQQLPSSVDANWTAIADVSPDWSSVINKPVYSTDRITYGDGTSSAITSSNLIYSSGSLYIKNGPYLSGDAADKQVDISYGRLRINGGTKVTGDAGASFKIKETWNDAGMIGYTQVINITDTASDVNSLLDLKNVNSVPVYQLRKDSAISLGINNATPWKNGVGAMIAMSKPSTEPSTAAVTDSAILWYSDTLKRFKYIDDLAVSHTIPNRVDTTLAQSASSGLVLSPGEWMMVSGYAVAPKMPASPNVGDRILVTDIGGTAQSSLITLDGNGKTFIGGDYAESSTFSIDLNYGKVSFVYNGTLWVANIA